MKDRDHILEHVCKQNKMYLMLYITLKEELFVKQLYSQRSQVYYLEMDTCVSLFLLQVAVFFKQQEYYYILVVYYAEICYQRWSYVVRRWLQQLSGNVICFESRIYIINISYHYNNGNCHSCRMLYYLNSKQIIEELKISVQT